MRVWVGSPAAAMAGHFDPDLFRQIVARFMEEMRQVPARFGMQQPLKLAELPVNTTHAIGQLSKHMQLGDADAQWLMCLASHLEPELGATLVPALWRLKEDVVKSTERRQRPREPSPFSLPPAAAESGSDETCEVQGPAWKKRLRSSSPQCLRPGTAPDLHITCFSSVRSNAHSPAVRKGEPHEKDERRHRTTVRESCRTTIERIRIKIVACTADCRSVRDCSG